MGAHLVKIHTAERGEERTEHHHGEDGVDDGSKEVGSIFELRNPVEGEIDDGTCRYSHRERPIFQKLLDTHIWGAKLRKK